jgi:excisionase family DNA binding protein
VAKETQTATQTLTNWAYVANMTQPLVVWTVEDLATYLKVEPSTVYERLRFRGSQEPNPMPAHKMGGYWRFLKHEIDAWLISLPPTNRTRKRKYMRRSSK